MQFMSRYTVMTVEKIADQYDDDILMFTAKRNINIHRLIET
jgi:hypothetical protein